MCRSNSRLRNVKVSAEAMSLEKRALAGKRILRGSPNDNPKSPSMAWEEEYNRRLNTQLNLITCQT